PPPPSSPPFPYTTLFRSIHDLYGDKDRRRGVEGTFMWFMQEVGELATALRHGSHEERALEFADVLAWLATLANGVGVDLDAAVRSEEHTSELQSPDHLVC